jgi:hypothetical protein
MAYRRSPRFLGDPVAPQLIARVRRHADGILAPSGSARNGGPSTRSSGLIRAGLSLVAATPFHQAEADAREWHPRAIPAGSARLVSRLSRRPAEWRTGFVTTPGSDRQAARCQLRCLPKVPGGFDGGRPRRQSNRDRRAAGRSDRRHAGAADHSRITPSGNRLAIRRREPGVPEAHASPCSSATSPTPPAA